MIREVEFSGIIMIHIFQGGFLYYLQKMLEISIHRIYTYSM